MKQYSGFYGKVPSHSDFIRHNLPRSFIDPWDDWLQSAFAASKEQLKETWLETYLTSPIYRFVLTPGLCGKESHIGIVMPSVDKIGRYYPFVLSAKLDNSGNPFHFLKRYHEWFESAQKLALSTLEDTFDLDEFTRSLTPLDMFLTQIPSNMTDSTTEENTQGDVLLIRETLDSPDQLKSLYPTLLHKTLREVCHAYSLWWTTGSERIAPSLLISEGLPPASNSTAIFAGDWSKWGWMDEDPLPQPTANRADNNEDPS